MRKRNRLPHSLVAQCREMLSKTGVRQWLLASLVFLALGVMLIASQAPEYDYQVGDQAEEDIQAPGPIRNRYRTELLQAEAAREAEVRAQADESYYSINPIVVSEAQDRVEQVFSELLATLDIEEEPEALDDEELQLIAERVRQRLLED